MFETKQDVAKLAEKMGVEITGLEELPRIHTSDILFQHDGDVYQAEGRKMVFTETNDGVLTPQAEVSEQYKDMQYWEPIGQFLNSFQELPEFGLDSIKINLHPTLGKCFTEFKSKNAVEIKKGDNIFPHLTLGNSCDTTERLWWLGAAMREICTNGMMAPDSRFPSEKRRRLHKKGSLSIEHEVERFLSTFEEMSESLGIWKQYAKLQITNDNMSKVFNSMAISEKQGSEILALPIIGEKTNLESKLLGGKTADGWPAYNAVTQWITHETTNQLTQIERGVAASKAFDKLLVH